MSKEQKLVVLDREGGKYLNFFYTPGSIDSLSNYLGEGWLVKEMEIDRETEQGWVLLEREY